MNDRTRAPRRPARSARRRTGRAVPARSASSGVEREASQSGSDIAITRSARAYASALGTPSSAIRSAANAVSVSSLVGRKEWAHRDQRRRDVPRHTRRLAFGDGFARLLDLLPRERDRDLRDAGHTGIIPRRGGNWVTVGQDHIHSSVAQGPNGTNKLAIRWKGRAVRPEGSTPRAAREPAPRPTGRSTQPRPCRCPCTPRTPRDGRRAARSSAASRSSGARSSTESGSR